MAIIRPAGKDAPEKTEYIYGFQKGVNALQDESLIDDHELTTHINGILMVDGIQKRPGSLYYGSASNSRVYSASPFYTSATSNNRWILRDSGTSLMYYNGSNVPTAVSGGTITSGLRGEYVMARDTLYYVNGTDALTKIAISGGVPVASTFTTLTTPTGLILGTAGSAGTTTYSYRVSAYNSVGETLACVSVTIATGNATLSSTNYVTLSWTAVPGATGYIVYGRKRTADNGIGETKMTNVTTNSYNDTGVDTPSTFVLPAEGNTTVGPKGTMVLYAMGRLFIAGDPSNPSRLYYSAGGTLIDDFSGANVSGSLIDISKNDGQKIRAIYYYQNSIVVWKDHSIWKFTFGTTGLPTVEIVTNEIGGISFRGIKIVNNDLWFPAIKDGRFAVFSLGYAANYLANAWRTTEKSLPISNGSLLDGVNLAQAQYSAGFFFRNWYGIAVANGSQTYNDRIYVYDVRFNCWIGYWTGMAPNCFFTYIDANQNEELYYGDELTGYIVKMFTGTDDNGTAISWKLVTKNFNQKLFDQYKIYRNPILWFKNVTSGSVTGYIINDGIFNSGLFNISPTISGIGFGYDKWGTFKFGTSKGAAATTANSDQPMEIIFNKTARSIKIELDEATSTGSFKFLGLSYKWLLLDGKPLPSTNRIRLST